MKEKKEEKRRGIRIEWINERSGKRSRGNMKERHKTNKGKEERNHFVRPP
jgi:hypothetical protein